jgi:hypothetical protein
MPFDQTKLPEWNKAASKPAQTKLDNGWSAEEKPPAAVFNWLQNQTFLALKELQENALHKEALNVDIELKIHRGTTAPTDTKILWIDTATTPYKFKAHNGTTWVEIGQTPPVTSVNNKTGAVSLTASDVGAATSGHTHNSATQAAAGFMSTSDKTKLDGIQTGAQVNTVTSVNTKTGSVVLSASDVGAATSTHGHSTATQAASGFLSAADKKKLDEIQAGAQVNAVTSVNSKTGAVSLTASDVGAAPTNHAHSEATTAASGFMSAADKTKINNIETGAQVNTVTSVAGKTGAVTVTKSDVGLSSVSNYGLATQAEAEAGTSSSKYMTPLRTAQAIAKLAPSPNAASVSISDAGGYYTGTNTEAALQEVGQMLNAMRGDLITSANSLLGM